MQISGLGGCFRHPELREGAMDGDVGVNYERTPYRVLVPLLVGHMPQSLSHRALNP